MITRSVAVFTLSHAGVVSVHDLVHWWQSVDVTALDWAGRRKETCILMTFSCAFIV